MLAFDPVSGTGNSINVYCGQLGLTVIRGAAILCASPHWDTGSRNPANGEKSPHSIAAFLCTSLFRAALSRLFTMTGCGGQVSHLAAPFGGFRPHYSPSPDSVETISGGYSHQTESTV